MIDLLKGDLNDIPPQLVQQAFSLYNRLFSSDMGQWNTAPIANRRFVLERLRGAFKKIRLIENVYKMTDSERIQLWILNNEFCKKEHSPSCPSCRRRMLKNIQRL